MMSTATSETRITTPEPREIHIERIVNAPREKVWRAFTEPALIAQWWGNGGGLSIEKNELVRGGHWRYVDTRTKEGNGFEGRYREVNAPERLVRSFEWDGMPAHVAIEFITLVDLGDGRTRIDSVLQMHTPEERDGFLHSGMQQGMDASYGALDKVLASS